jgi:phosphate-selective porin OprO/OprP
MRPHPSLCAGALLAALALPAAAAVPVATVGDSEVTFEGLLQYDGNWYDNDLRDLDGDADDSDNEEAIRRAEFVLKGAGPGPLAWVVGYDPHARRWLDVNLAWKLAGGNTLVFGQAKVPFGLDELGSSRTADFMAKAAAVAAFAPSRRIGVQWQGSGEHWYAAAGVFGREMAQDTARGDGVAARLAWSPIVGEGRLLHLGVAGVVLAPEHDTVRLRARPQADLSALRLVDTGALLDADRQRSVGLEAAWVFERVKLQGEWLRSQVERRAGTGDFVADGGYVSAVWNLGGETWGYRNGVVTAPAPAHPAGLWQLGVRYDTLDFDDRGVAGGTMRAWTGGVNWYWRAHARLSLNYVAVASERNGVGDDPDIVEARVQFHW